MGIGRNLWRSRCALGAARSARNAYGDHRGLRWMNVCCWGAAGPSAALVRFADRERRDLVETGPCRKREQKIALFASTGRYDCKRQQLADAALSRGFGSGR